MEGIDLVTEGILTITKVTRILKDYSPSYALGKGTGRPHCKTGAAKRRNPSLSAPGSNVAHQDPNLPIDLEIRRTVVKRMARILEEKFLKEVTIQYI
jgi:hypothetical protein